MPKNEYIGHQLIRAVMGKINPNAPHQLPYFTPNKTITIPKNILTILSVLPMLFFILLLIFMCNQKYWSVRKANMIQVKLAYDNGQFDKRQFLIEVYLDD